MNDRQDEITKRIVELDELYFARRNREIQSSYAAGSYGRMNPIPKGINPLGSDANSHYKSEHSYFLMVERARDAVRNHPLVEQGINRLIANMRLDEITLDVDSGDEEVDKAQKDFWKAWGSDASACDYEGVRTLQSLARQSFFSKIADGDILHVPLEDGSLQSFESHQLRSPAGFKNTDLKKIVHGVETINNRVVAYHVTPLSLQPAASPKKTRRFAAFDSEGNKLAFWLGFTQRFYQNRGISRLSSPREAMNGFDDLNYAHIKSSLRRALISYLMHSTSSMPQGPAPLHGTAALPQSGDRYLETGGTGLRSAVVEQVGEPAQVFKAPEGWKIEGWNANMPGSQFFEQAGLLLTMLAVNLDMPLSFLLLDGSLVNFHGGRMTWDQVKLRMGQLIKDQIDGFYAPIYEWKTRQRLIPGSPLFDRALFNAVKGGVNPFRYKFRAPGWPYVKPLEDASSEDLAEKRNLKSHRSILAARGIDFDEFVPEVIHDRKQFAREAIKAAVELQQEFPEVITSAELPRLWRELRYGNDSSGVQLAVTADTTSDQASVSTKAEAPK